MTEDFWLSTLEDSLGTPWHVKTDSPNTNARRDYICNVQGRPILELVPVGGEWRREQYESVRNLASEWPRLVAALTEAVFTLEESGVPPTSELVTLLRYCGGPDLSDRLGAEPLPKPEQQPKPQNWNNSTQSATPPETEQPSGERLLAR